VAPDRPNVLLVVLDTARADHFGPLGGLAATPSFDRLAARGTAVRAFAAAPWTVPSHASLFSGLLPFEHGVTGAAAIGPDRRLASLRPRIDALRGRWLPEAFRRAGYRTVAISANVWITPSMGFDAGFEEYHAVGMAAVTPRGEDHHWRARDLVPQPVLRRAKRGARYVRDARRGRDFGSRRALDLLRGLAASPGERPLFCFVNLMECHAPYLPPDGWNPLRGRDRLRGPAVNHRYLGDAFVAAYTLGAEEIPDDALRILRALYAGEVAYADHVLGQALEAFAPLGDRTVVAVTADHGENLGEDHRLGHVLSLDRRLLEVPLALAAPEPPPLPAVPSLADVPRLLAAAAGLDESPFPVRDGTVALAQYEGGWAHLRRAPDVARHHHLDAAQERTLRAPMLAATDGTTLMVRTADADRVETLSDAAGVPGVEDAKRLGTELDRLPAEPPASTATGATPTEEAEIEERLRELGYL
jgi:arylsulfatase A-like enzyme